MRDERKSYYGERYAGRSPRRRSLVAMLSVVVLFLITIALGVALVIAYVTPHVEPSSYGSLTIAGIFTPLLFTAVLVLMLLWLVLRRWIISGVLLLLLVPGLFHIDEFYSLPIFREVEKPVDKRAFDVMSYNLRGFFDDNGVRCVDRVVEYFEGRELPDVACFQEFSCDAQGIEQIDSLFKDYDMRETIESGFVKLRTYSRYPIVANDSISGAGRGTSQWVDVVIERNRTNDTLRIFNNHLYTMNISAADSEDIARGKILQDGERVKSIVDRIANNSAIRAAHADTLKMVMNATTYPYVVCGDFNDTPMSFVYNLLADGMKDAFKEHGTGYGYTFRPMHGMLRIDYVLYSMGIEAFSYAADEGATLSDHLPITVSVKVK